MRTLWTRARGPPHGRDPQRCFLRRPQRSRRTPRDRTSRELCGRGGRFPPIELSELLHRHLLRCGAINAHGQRTGPGPLRLVLTRGLCVGSGTTCGARRKRMWLSASNAMGNRLRRMHDSMRVARIGRAEETPSSAVTGTICANARPFSAQVPGTQCSTKFVDTESNTPMSVGSGARTLPVCAAAVMPRSARGAVVICNVFGLRSSSATTGFGDGVGGAAEVPAGSELISRHACSPRSLPRDGVPRHHRS